MALVEVNNPFVKVYVTFWAFLECVLLSGVGYGWATFVFIFKEEGIYSNLCASTENVNASAAGNTTTNFDNESVKTEDYYLPGQRKQNIILDAVDEELEFATCVAQDSAMSLCFTVAVLVGCVYSFLIGQVHLKFGTMISRLLSSAVTGTGTLCLAFVSRESPWLMFPGMCCLMAGSLFILISNLQISKMFTRGGSIVIGILSGSLDMSSGVSLLIKISFLEGFSRRNSFLILSGLQVMVVISTIFHLPREHFEEEVAEPETIDVNVINKPELPHPVDSNENRPKSMEFDTTDDETLFDYLKQPMFLSHLTWFSFVQLRFLYFVGNLNSLLNRMLDNNISQVSYFSDACFYTLMAGILTAPLAGIIYDRMSRRFAKASSKLYRGLMPALVPLSVPSITMILSCSLLLTSYVNVLYIVFINTLIHRAFLYATTLIFITSMYPLQFAAVLYGVTMTVGGVFSCLQYAIFSWAAAYDSAPQHVEIFFLLTGILTLGHPVYLFLIGYKDEKKSKRKGTLNLAEYYNYSYSTYL